MVFRSVAPGLLLALLGGCGTAGSAPATPTLRHDCPAGWAAAAVGGCGPAVLLCAPDGGAAAGACDAVDLAHPSPIALPDGSSVPGFARLPDGTITGPWPEPDDPDGPFAASWAPAASTCAPGWSPAADGTCDPSLRSTCAAGSEALPGGRCTPTGLANCPARDYADLGPEAAGARVVYVRTDADAATADGTAAHPCATIADGARLGGSGAWLLLAAGSYAEAVETSSTLHLVGVCAARVTLRGGATATNAIVRATGASASLDLRGVTVTGARRGVQADLGATLLARAVVVAGDREAGFLALDAGTRLEVTGAVVRSIRAPAGGTSGQGLRAQGGATLRATDVVVDDSTESGVVALAAGTLVELTGCVVRATRPRADGTQGRGLDAHLGATLRATGVVVDGNTEAGVIAADPGTLVELTGGLVRGTLPTMPNMAAGGVLAQMGATLRATAVTVTGNAGMGMLANDSGTLLETTGSTVRGTLVLPGGALGVGLGAVDGATLRATGVLVADNASAGVLTRSAATVLEMTASVVRGALGVWVRDGATFRATGLRVVDSATLGVFATGAGARAELTRCAVENTAADASGLGGFGLEAVDGATLRATGVAITGATNAGVVVEGAGSSAELAGCVVRGTRPSRAGLYGRGLEAHVGTSVRATALLLADNTEAALVLWSDAQFSDLLVVGVAGSARGFGAGLYAIAGAQVDGARMAFASVGGAGVAALPLAGVGGARVTASDLFVRDVRPSTVRFNETGGTLQPVGRAVAYALHVGAGCTVDATRALLDRGGFGLFNAQGVMRVQGDVIAHQGEGAGSYDLATPASATTLTAVTFVGNASDALVRRDDLPIASELPAPAPVGP